MNNETDQIHYSQRVSTGGWAACTISYYVPWRIVIKNSDTGETVHEYVQDLTVF